MNISVFGGTGETGLLVIKKALDKGHTVTAFARNPSKIAFRHDRLKIVKGELTDTDKIESAIKNTDAVLSVLGPTGRTTGLPVSTGIGNIIHAMHKQSVKRLVATTTPSYKDPNDKFDLGLALFILIIRLLLKDTYRDVVEIGRAVVNSHLDWTLVRIPLLLRKPAKGKLNIGYMGDGKVKLFLLTREDLADFLVRQIDDQSYIGKSPVISN